MLLLTINPMDIVVASFCISMTLYMLVIGCGMKVVSITTIELYEPVHSMSTFGDVPFGDVPFGE